MFVSYVFMHTCVLVFLPICFTPSSPVSHLPFPQGNAVRADGAEDDVKQVRACARAWMCACVRSRAFGGVPDDGMKQWSGLVSVIRSRCIGRYSAQSSLSSSIIVTFIVTPPSSFGYMFVATTSKNQVHPPASLPTPALHLVQCSISTTSAAITTVITSSISTTMMACRSSFLTLQHRTMS